MKMTPMGFGGDSSSTPVNASQDPDTLFSSSTVYMLLCLAGGEIKGPIGSQENWEKHIYLNDTPLRADDLNGVPQYNFTSDATTPGVEWDYRPGTQTQAYMAKWPLAQDEIEDGRQIKHGDPGPVSVTVADTDVDAVRLTLGFPRMMQTDPDTGRIHGSHVELSIDIEGSDGAGFIPAVPSLPLGTTDPGGPAVIVDGLCSNRYQRAVVVDLTLCGHPGPWTIRITRNTLDSSSVSVVNESYLDSYTLIKNLNLRYPNKALLGLKTTAKSFTSVPTVSVEADLLIVQVPSNYTAPVWNETTKTWTPAFYTGEWDGSFRPDWTNDPAWIFRDLLTNPRYGLGNYINEEMIDDGLLYQISRYCMEQVDDGFGGKEPRFTCNCYIQSQREAYQVISDLASVFRGMVYWASGNVSVSQDCPRQVAYLFNESNVADGLFTYASTATRQRHNTVLVTWNDPADSYKQKVEYVADDDAIAETGKINSIALTAFGCTSRGQAHRLGLWTIYTEKYETETVTFTTGFEGIMIRPGSIIAVSDQSRGQVSLDGRIAEAGDVDRQVLDRPVPAASIGDVFWGTLPDGTVATRKILNVVGNVVTTEPFPEPLGAMSVWQISTADHPTQYYRMISAKEKDSTTYEVCALQYHPGKFDYIEKGWALDDTPDSIPSSLPTSLAAPTNIVIGENVTITGVTTTDTMTVGWSQVASAASYALEWRKVQGNWERIDNLATNYCEVPNVTAGDYEVRVYAKFMTLISPPGSATATMVGHIVAPDDVTNFTATPQDASIQFAWAGISNLDLNYYEIRKGSWAGELVATQIKGTSFVYQTADVLADYYIKAVDTSGNWSVNAVKATLSSDPWDDFLIPSEKKDRKADRDRLMGEKTVLDAQADAVNVGRSGYDNALGALETYLGTLTSAGGWDSVAHDWKDYISIYPLGTGGGATMAGVFQTAKLSRDALVNAINGADGDDDTLSIPKKQALAQQWAAILQVQTSLDSIATSLGITTEKTAYDSAISAVPTFFSSHQTPKVWTDLTGPTALGSGGGATLRGLLVAIAAKAQALQNAISNQAISLANQALAAAPKMISALVALPNANYPQNQLVYLIAPWTDTSGIVGTAGKVYQRGIYRADLTASVWSWSRDGITASMIVDQLIAGQISAGIIGAQELAAVIALASIIESTNYQAGVMGTGPVGFYLGPPKNVTLKDGSTLANCAFELGGNASIGGFQASVVAQGAVHDSMDITSTTTWTCPDGMKLATLVLCAAGGGGHTSGGGGGGGETVQVAIKPTPGTTYTIHIPSASAAAMDGGDAWMLPQGQTWKGDWASGTSYAVGDVVYSGGIYYRCTTVNSAQQPPNASYWAACADVRVVARGGKGASGEDGADGGGNPGSGAVKAAGSDSPRPDTVIPISSVRYRSIHIPGAGGGADADLNYRCSSGGQCAENSGGIGVMVTSMATGAGAGGGASALGQGGHGSTGTSASAPPAGEYGGGGGGGKNPAGGGPGKAVLWW